MTEGSLQRRVFQSDTAVLIYLSLITLIIHCIFSGQYGYFRDEFYYLACGEHLDWGYVDHPPFIALAAFLTRRLLGDSLLALRFVPALAEALVVLLTGLMARELGGGRFTQVLAALSVMVAGDLLALGHIFSMNAFDHLFWALCLYVVILILKYDRPRLWLLFGLLAGVGLMNKYSIGFLGLGLVVGLILTPARKYLRSGWLWLGSGLALLIFLPHVLWEIRTSFPTLEFIRNATLYKIAPLSPVGFILETILGMNPLTLPIWLAGLWFYFIAREGKSYRLLGWIYVSVLILFLSTKAKTYYFAPAFPMLWAAGALVIEGLIRRCAVQWLKPVLVGALVVGGMVLAPFAMPVLPVEMFIRYSNWMGFKPPSGETHRTGKLPQFFADMHGWKEMVAVVAEVYESLPPEERAKCAIYASNYGQAGAIDLFGKKYGLPKAICGLNSYYLWGPRDYTGEILISVGDSVEDNLKAYNEVTTAATITNEYVMPYENNIPVNICRKPKAPLKELWPMTKVFD